jgi:fluoroacetyl-CoA thioesterase
MDVTEYVQPGMKEEITFQVEQEQTAVHVGSGGLKVLATPIMIAYMERVSRTLLDKVLPKGYSSVGVHVNVRHLAPTPLGGQVWVMCEVLQVDGRRVLFDVQARDDEEMVGDGRHERVVIDVERFLQRVAAKQKA